jgi:uncharacterized protein
MTRLGDEDSYEYVPRDRPVIEPKPYNGIYNCPNGLHPHIGRGFSDCHGYEHWERVVQNGLTMARCNGADQLVVSLFAWLHDSRRENDDHDPKHGARAASMAIDLQGKVYDLSTEQMDSLVWALVAHDNGKVSRDITVGTCWDADRLDLPRVGIIPDPLLMSTAVGKAMAQEVQHRYTEQTS